MRGIYKSKECRSDSGSEKRTSISRWRPLLAQQRSLCYAMVMIWHDPFSFTAALASVVVWGLGGHSGSTRSSWARYMYFAFGVFFLQLRAQDKQHLPHRSTDSCGGCVVLKRYSPCLSRLNTNFQRTVSRKKLSTVIDTKALMRTMISIYMRHWYGTHIISRSWSTEATGCNMMNNMKTYKIITDITKK